MITNGFADICIASSLRVSCWFDFSLSRLEPRFWSGVGNLSDSVVSGFVSEGIPRHSLDDQVNPQLLSTVAGKCTCLNLITVVFSLTCLLARVPSYRVPLIFLGFPPLRRSYYLYQRSYNSLSY